MNERWGHVLRVTALIVTIASSWQSVFAHSGYETTAPVDGAVLSETPREVAIVFDKPMRITTISLTDDAGNTFDVMRSDDMRPITHFKGIPSFLPAGNYTFRWRGLSEDGHSMKGEFSFEVEN